jgi:hypothetical protein
VINVERKRPSDEAIQRALNAILPGIIRIIKEEKEKKKEQVDDGKT